MKEYFAQNLNLIKKRPALFLMFLPGLLLMVVFKYIPLGGLVIAFKDYNFYDGILASPWVGLENFKRLFVDIMFKRALLNTIFISFLRLIVEFPAPLILALMLNEVKALRTKKFFQTVSYLPHFISWIIIVNLLTVFFSPSTGLVNLAIKAMGGDPIYFLASKEWFVPILIITNIWKEVGWGTVVYLAAISGIDPGLYEAAEIDGAGKFRQTLHITLPSLVPVTAVLFIMRTGNILNAGFDQIFNMYNPAVYSVADIIDTLVYRLSMVDLQLSFSTAVGFFKSLIGLVMLVTVNWIIRKITDNEQGLW